MESQQAMMKAVNAYYRKHKTLEGCPELTAEQVEKVKAAMSQDWCKDPVPFPSYLLTNNNANIRRVRQRIEELSHKAEFVGWTFPGGEARVNEAENRLQLIFEEKPDPGYEDKYDAMELRTIQDWIVKRQLSGIPGIVEINSFGAEVLKPFELMRGFLIKA